MKFSIQIDCGNAAFQPQDEGADEHAKRSAALYEVGSILGDLFANGWRDTHGGNLFDTNGNRVGSWSLERTPREEADAAAEEGPRGED